jgi:hypothetical protein
LPYRLSTFDGLAIPSTLGGSGYHEIGLTAQRAKLLDIPGGVWDPLGTLTSPRGASTVQAKVMLMAASQAALKTALDAWDAKDGMRGTLVRISEAGATQTATARLTIPTPQRGYNHRTWIPLTLVFDVLSPVWSGTARDYSFSLSGSPTDYVLTQAGNMVVKNPIITLIAPAGGSITGFSIQNLTTPTAYLTYTGTIAATKLLTIDCGAMFAWSNVVGSDYAHFFLDPTYHQIDGWFYLWPGAQTIRVYYTGTNWGVCHIVYNDGFA